MDANLMVSTLVTNPVVRDKLLKLEAALKAGPTIECPVAHFFTGHGLYARTMFIQKGTVLVGKIHKEPQIFILAMGEMSILAENGVNVIDAPYVAASPAGVKRAGYAHSDCLVVTVHKTDITDPEKVEDALATATYEEYLAFCKGQGQLEELA